VKHICFYHAGCPDGFGAAWAARHAWGESALYIPRSHQHEIRAEDYAGDWVAYVDIAPGNDELLKLAEVAERVTVLDHHVTARDGYHADLAVVNRVEDLSHEVIFDMTHSGAVLSWQYFSDGAPTPPLLRYVEDQDLWNWALPDSEEINAAIGAYPHRFDVWDELANRPIEELAREGASIVRSNRVEVERSLRHAHPITIDGQCLEAVNSRNLRSAIGHELAKRKAFGVEWGCVYRMTGDQVHGSLYSIGEVDVASVAKQLGGGGHRNAAGFTVTLRRWVDEFLSSPTG
jgi:oligoribonuclease NrnB/cAMP/cGMP phosphodiesterase (DHH superfamily)